MEIRERFFPQGCRYSTSLTELQERLDTTPRNTAGWSMNSPRACPTSTRMEETAHPSSKELCCRQRWGDIRVGDKHRCPKCPSAERQGSNRDHEDKDCNRVGCVRIGSRGVWVSQPLVQEHQDRSRARSQVWTPSGSSPHFLTKPNSGRIRASSIRAGAASARPMTKATPPFLFLPSLCPRVLPRSHSPSPWPSRYLRHRRHLPASRSVA